MLFGHVCPFLKLKICFKLLRGLFLVNRYPTALFWIDGMDACASFSAIYYLLSILGSDVQEKPDGFHS